MRKHFLESHSFQWSNIPRDILLPAFGTSFNQLHWCLPMNHRITQPRDSWQCLDIYLIVTTGRMKVVAIVTSICHIYQSVEAATMQPTQRHQNRFPFGLFGRGTDKAPSLQSSIIQKVFNSVCIAPSKPYIVPFQTVMLLRISGEAWSIQLWVKCKFLKIFIHP
jgi:hypothetical protein